MRHLTVSEVLELHRRLIGISGGATEIRDLGGLESTVAQPHAAFGDQELYPDVDEQEKIILDLATGQLTRDAFVCWLKDHSANY